MNIKLGNVVCHAGAIEWGTGKVVEVTAARATIQFSDGIIRKIASSHYTILKPADPASFVALPDIETIVATRATPKRRAKPKQPAV